MNPQPGGAANIIKTERLGELVLTASNGYTVATTISGGTLQIGNNTAGSSLSTSGVTFSNNAVLGFYSTSALSENGAITGGAW